MGSLRGVLNFVWQLNTYLSVRVPLHYQSNVLSLLPNLFVFDCYHFAERVLRALFGVLHWLHACAGHCC